MLRIISIFILLAGCANTKPTPYQAMKKNEGYKEKELENLKVVVFRGNAYSKKPKVKNFAEFRAIEVCREQGKKLANIFDYLDKTTSKDVVRTSSFGPSYYYGMSPFYSRYSGIGFSAGFGDTQSNSWKETYVYPNIEVVFRCSDTVVKPQLIMREVPAEEMKHLVKDLKGGIQIEKLQDNSPNKGIIYPGDIILKAGEERIEKIYQLLSGFTPESPTQTVQILRDGERQTVTVKAKDMSKEIAELEQQIVAQTCKDEEIKKRAICKS